MDTSMTALALLKEKYHKYKRETGYRPQFVICDEETQTELLNSTWAPHFLDTNDGVVVFMGMKMAVVAGNKLILEVR